MSEFTHIDAKGRIKMVDISEKSETIRKAVARAMVKMKDQTFEKIYSLKVKKGNVLETARIAGIMAAKKTSELIPLCHPISVTEVKIDFRAGTDKKSIVIDAIVRTKGRTGVEMEALTAVSIAGLTIYDMCKSYDREMEISNINLIEKSGGKSGHFVRKT